MKVTFYNKNDGPFSHALCSMDLDIIPRVGNDVLVDIERHEGRMCEGKVLKVSWDLANGRREVSIALNGEWC